jgi:serine/threonine protein kinase
MKRVAASGKKMEDLFTLEVRDLIAKLLTTDPDNRLTATGALAHPWLRDAPSTIDIFTEKEKCLILKEY